MIYCPALIRMLDPGFCFRRLGREDKEDKEEKEEWEEREGA